MLNLEDVVVMVKSTLDPRGRTTDFDTSAAPAAQKKDVALASIEKDEPAIVGRLWLGPAPDFDENGDVIEPCVKGHTVDSRGRTPSTIGAPINENLGRREEVRSMHQHEVL